MARPVPAFSPKSLAFLRALARHNDREWFREHKDEFEAVVRAPMVALVEQLAEDFRDFAPDLVATPSVSIFRMYRDTRFSADKTPLKTHIAAVFPHHALGRMEGASLYVQLDGRQLMVAGGLYAPAPRDLHAVRAHIVANVSRFRSIVDAPAFKRVTGGLMGERSARPPRGFVVPEATLRYIMFKQFLVWHEGPASAATTPGFYNALLKRFRAAAPLIHFLNEPLVARPVDPLRP